mmetsp:Transcript_4521/g.14823  ORF Transcript_4521/g.14823 Transcript_4521/m.14823 type:complete len:208 (-) Transcript_4521:94-717(-)
MTSDRRRLVSSDMLFGERLARYSGSCHRLRRLSEIRARASSVNVKLTRPSFVRLADGRRAARGLVVLFAVPFAAERGRRMRREALRVALWSICSNSSGSSVLACSILSARSASFLLLRSSIAMRVRSAILRRVSSECFLPRFHGSLPLLAAEIFARLSIVCGRPTLKFTTSASAALSRISGEAVASGGCKRGRPPRRHERPAPTMPV